MIVRPVDLAKDAGAVMSGARDFISRLDYTVGIPETDDDLADALAALCNLPGFEITVVEHDGEIVGGIGMLYSPFLWNRKLMSASELFLWDSPEAPKVTLLLLLRAVHKRMAELNVTVPSFVRLTSSPEKLSGVYRKLGYRMVQETWAKAS